MRLIFLVLLFKIKIVFGSDINYFKEIIDSFDNIKGKFTQITLSEDGELLDKWKNKYDNDGNNIETNRYDKDGELLYKLKYKFDEKGNLIENNGYDKDGELMYKTEYEYKEFDNNKNWLKRIEYYKEYEDEKDAVIIKREDAEITEREIEYYD